MLGIDIVGPLKKCNSERKYIFVVTDYQIRLEKTRTTKDKSATFVEKFIFKEIMLLKKPQEFFYSIQVKEFLNSIVKILCNRMKWIHRKA